MKRFLSLILTAALLLSIVPIMTYAQAAEETTNAFVGYTAISTKEELNAIRNNLSGKYYLTTDIVFSESDFKSGGAFYNSGQGWAPIGTNDTSAFTGTFDGNGYAVKNIFINISSYSTVYAGLFSYNNGTIINLGMVDGSVSGSYAGGIAGYNTSSGTISNCYNTGNMSASDCAGGIVGENRGIISNCYNIGNMSSNNSGGIAGNNGGTISNCYNTGSVGANSSSSSSYSSSHACAGGIVGDNFGTISNCYNTGNMSASDRAGGIVGVSYYGTISNCYYLDNVLKGVGSGTDTTVKLTLNQMKQQSSYVGFNFDTVWQINIATDYSFPTLINVPHIEPPEDNINFAGGNGTAHNTYKISTKEQLNNVRKYLDASFVLINDIVFSESDFAEGGEFYNDGQAWVPIGTSSSSAFTGTFDGNGYAIKNLFINISSSSDFYAGLFGYNNRGAIKNLGMVDGSVSSVSGSYAGGIAGYSFYGTISNCYNTGNVSSPIYAGGIVGYNSSGTISNSYNTGSVSATSTSTSSFSCAGGIAGYNSGIISNSYNTGSVSATSTSTSSYAGGIAGYNSSGTINNCYNTGNVSSSKYAGGIVGYNAGIISTCYNTGSVSANSTSTSTSSYSYAGGIAGYNAGIISNCYNTGSVSATSTSTSTSSSSCAGGIAGFTSSNSSSISTCYNTGSVSATSYSTSSYAGGITGGWALGGISKCYYLDSLVKGVGEGTDTTIKLTFDQIFLQDSYVGFDFDTVWIMSPNYLPRLNAVSSSNLVALESISVSKSPTKLTYIEEKDLLDVTGGQITLTYDNGTSLVAALTSTLVTGFDNTKVGKQTLTVTFGGKTATFVIEIIAKSLSSISVTTEPTKLTYLKAKDALDVTGGRITLYYNNDTSEEIDMTSAMVTGFDNTQVGKQTLTVAYGGKTETFEIEIVAKSITSIAVTTKPIKLTYLEAKDTLDVTGGKITLYYNNDTSEEIAITSDMVSGFDNTQVGSQILTVTYGGKTATFEIEIVAKSLASIAVTTESNKLTYLEAKDALDVTGGRITLYYNNDTSEEIDMTSAMVSGFDNTKVGKQTLTVTYGGKTATFEIEIITKSLSSIAITAEPTKLTYLEAKDNLNVTGGKIALYYNNDTREQIDMTFTMITGFDNSKVGTQTLTVTYGGKTATFEIEVIAKSLSSISVSTNPIKLTYLVAKEALDVAGGKIALYYNNDTSEEIDMTSSMVSGFDNSKVGTQTLTVTYGGKTATFEVEVIAKSLSSIAVTTEPTKLTYIEEKDNLDITGGKITLYYNNDTSEEIDMTADMISGFNNTIIGKQTLTVTYSGKAATFEIEVIENTLVADNLGDVNGDGKISILDALDIFKCIAGKTPAFTGSKLANSDINTDGKITIMDALSIFKHIAGKVSIT